MMMYLLVSNLYIRHEIDSFEDQYKRYLKREGGIFKYKGLVFVLSILVLPLISIVDNVTMLIKDRDARYNLVFALILAAISFVLVYL
jgi:hypothetical protein